MNQVTKRVWMGGLIACLVIPAQAGSWTGQVEAGAGYWAGRTTYSIGGSAWTPQDGNVELPDKISELKFPMDVACGVVEGSLLYRGRLEVHGSFMANLTDPSTKVQDSDFGIFDSSPSDQLDVYSESDATLNAMAADVGLRYWFRVTSVSNRVASAVGVGPDVFYQKADWTISNLDQWYPSRPRMGHDFESGQVATYSAEIIMPCVEASFKARYKDISGRVTVGVGPALVSDKDDHMLVQKKSTGDMVGVGVKGAAEVQYDFSRHAFVRAQMNALSVQATGTQTQRGYGGDNAGFYGEIDETFSSVTASANLALGFMF